MDGKSKLPEETHSFWLETGKRETYPQLEHNYEIDTAVVGGGIAGILTAYSLVKAGNNVALFEGRELLSGTTGNTTAKLSAQHQLIYNELIQRYGEIRAKDFYEANMEGINYLHQIAKELDMENDIKAQNAYVYTQDPDKQDTFKHEAEAYVDLGIAGRLLSDIPLDMNVEAAVEMNDQAEFHPVSFLHKVLAGSKGLQERVFEHTLIKNVDRDGDGVLHLKTDVGHTITCNHAIFTTHYPTFEPDSHFANMTPKMSYALAYRKDESKLDGMYISDDTPKKTFRGMQVGDKHYLLVGGQSHTVGDDYSEENRYEEIDAFAKQTFGVGDPIYRWSSHDMMTKDRIPLIGQLHPDYPNVFTATGFSKWGLADAAVGARLLTDLVLDNHNRYTKMYDPRREIPDLPDKETSSQTSENDAVDPLRMPDKLENLRPNEATIVKQGNDNMGVYKDKQGALHYLDLTCTHMGCGVQWNDGDKTWDCPCHGSRFNACGEVIEGPALTKLKTK